MFKAQLCKCNNCDNVMIDENPQVGQPELPVPDNYIEMERGEDEDGYYVGCSECHTDAYLMDLYEI